MMCSNIPLGDNRWQHADRKPEHWAKDYSGKYVILANIHMKMNVLVATILDECASVVYIISTWENDKTSSCKRS